MEEQKKSYVSKFVKKHLTAKMIGGLVVAALLVLAVFGISKKFYPEQDTVKIGLEDIGELATQSAYVTEINTTKSPRTLFGMEIPFTQSHYVYSYDFVIKAGFEVDDIIPKVDEENKIVKISMPKPKVLSNEPKLDSFKVYIENESVFRQVSLTENNEALIKLQKQAEKNVIANGLLEGAKENAETVITGLFANQLNPKEYEYKFTFEE